LLPPSLRSSPFPTAPAAIEPYPLALHDALPIFGGYPLTFGDERHLRGDLPGAGPLQLGAAVPHHARPRRQPRRQVDHRVRIGVRPGRVVEIEVLTVAEVHPPVRHPCPGNPLELPIPLGAARDRAGGHGRIDGDRLIAHVISLRRHYPVRFVRSTAPSAVLSAHWRALPRGQFRRLAPTASR